MPIAWYIVPYKIKQLGSITETSRYVALVDFHKQIVADGARWTETEILGDRAIVKVKASDAMLSILDAEYKRLPKNRLDDSLSNLPSNIKTALKNEILDMGYSLSEIKGRFGDDLGSYTLRDVLKFMTMRRLKPRYVAEEDTIVPDGIIQNCTLLESVDSEIQ